MLEVKLILGAIAVAVWAAVWIVRGTVDAGPRDSQRTPKGELGASKEG